MKYILIVVFLLSAGCSNQQVYDSIQTSERNKCTQEPTPALKKECEEKLMPYRDYERERQE